MHSQYPQRHHNFILLESSEALHQVRDALHRAWWPGWWRILGPTDLTHHLTLTRGWELDQHYVLWCIHRRERDILVWKAIQATLAHAGLQARYTHNIVEAIRHLRAPR